LEKDILVTGRGQIDIVFELIAHPFSTIRSAERRGGKPLVTGKRGEELHRDTGRFRWIERIIDRGRNRYYEKVVDDQGTIIQEADEPLDEHQRHGSAKPRRDPETGTPRPRTD